MDRTVRVLQLIDSLARAGAEQSMATMAPHLLREGMDLHVAYLVPPDDLRAKVEASGIPVTSLASGPQSRRAWLSRTAQLISDLQPDVVHTTLFEADLAGRRAAAWLHVPCVSSFVNTAYSRTEVGRSGLRRVKVRAAQAADAVTAMRVTRFHAVTNHVARVMSRRLLVPRRKIETIPRGRDAAVLGRRTNRRRVVTRWRLGLAEEIPLVLAIGRHEPQKGLDVLLKAVPKVKSRFPDVRFLIAGREGRATPSLIELAHELDVADAVVLMGARDDVPDLLAAADVLAFPSLWEGAGGTLIEAMALECPIVSARLPTLLETIDESTALLVTPGSPNDLAKGVTMVLEDRHEAARRARAARVRFDNDFTIESSAQHMAALYRRVALSRG
jgi:glycosyltransferase involved in cell wall biosynthesis